VAAADAIIARPVSQIDQIATSVPVYRKLLLFERPPMYSMRIIVTTEALLLISKPVYNTINN
jgi:hypothetical protein